MPAFATHLAIRSRRDVLSCPRESGEEERVARGRLLVQLGLFVLVWLFVSAVGTAPPLVTGLSGSGVSELLLAAVVGLLAAVSGVLVVERVLGGPGLAALGYAPRGRWLADLGYGLALGPVVFAAVLAVLALVGLAHVAAVRLDAAALLASLVALACVGAAEELIMRGVLLQQVARGWGVRAGVIVSSVLFGLMHLPNALAAQVEPSVAGIALVLIGLLGVMFACAYLWTRSLWLPAALHLSWNFAQGPLLGFPVSGTTAPSILETRVAGPAWLTGGAFGPEGGLVGLVALGIAWAAIRVYASGADRAGAPRPARVDTPGGGD
jgi:membrane protease YdiL (CAAX protease family)